VIVGCACDAYVDQKAEAEKINKINDEWISSIKSGNVDNIVGLFAEKPLSMRKGEPLYSDAASTRKAVGGMLADPLVAQSFAFTDDSLEVSASGDIALNWGNQSFMMSTAIGPKEVPSKWLTLWKKIDGQWKVILDQGVESPSKNYPYSSPDLVEEMTKIEENWNEATLKKDAKALDLILAEEYTYVDDQAGRLNKEQTISDVTSGKTVFLEPGKISDVEVQDYGAIMLVRGKNTIRGMVSGTKVNGTYQFMDVFVWRDGRWQCISTK
jgi:ketosteroid isomerase-like protein